MMVQANQFYGLPSEDASADLQHFLEHQALSISILPCGKGETMVLPEQGSYRHVGQMFCSVPYEVFPHRQN
jgi:hypothetical protein